MVINIRGTSGSGKSTLVRDVMSRYATLEPVYLPARKRPFGYWCHRPDGPQLYVVGHYEMPTGGGDTISGLDLIYESVRAAAVEGDVIYEGLIIQSDNRRCIEIAKSHRTLVLLLNTPLELCLAGVMARRVARGDTRPLDPTNTAAKAKSLPAQYRKLTEAGVDARLVSRDEAKAACIEALRLGEPVEQQERRDVFQLS